MLSLCARRPFFQSFDVIGEAIREAYTYGFLLSLALFTFHSPVCMASNSLCI
jgi:hypothetical protein